MQQGHTKKTRVETQPGPEMQIGRREQCAHKRALGSSMGESMAATYGGRFAWNSLSHQSWPTNGWQHITKIMEKSKNNGIVWKVVATNRIWANLRTNMSRAHKPGHKTFTKLKPLIQKMQSNPYFYVIERLFGATKKSQRTLTFDTMWTKWLTMKAQNHAHGCATHANPRNYDTIWAKWFRNGFTKSYFF